VSREVLRYVDAVVDASMPPASRALAPLLRNVREAVEGVDGYEVADAALRRLERGVSTGRRNPDASLEGVLVGAMMNGTSAGAVEG
jgi:hypothetical protein